MTIKNWKNAPDIIQLQADFTASRVSHDVETAKVRQYLANLHPDKDEVKETTPQNPFEQYVADRKPKTRSSIKNKTIRKQAEWRYTALSEPFLNTPDMFNVDPARPGDEKSAMQNGLVLNNQINTKLNKVAFIDEMVRAVTDEGTVIIKTGWEYKTQRVKSKVPQFEIRPAETNEHVQILQGAANHHQSNLDSEWVDALRISTETGRPHFPFPIGDKEVWEDKTVCNQPSWQVCNIDNVYIDPTTNGQYEKAQFIIHSFETSKSEMEKTGLYTNLDKVQWTIDQDGYHNFTWQDQAFRFEDAARKKVIAYEYWGHWDIYGTGETVPIVVTWIGNVIVRMEENPYPDGELPFVIIPFMPVKKSVYGEPDGSLLKDNQDIAGAIQRGMIDLFGRSANAQTGIRKGALDVVNRRRFERGQDYEFNDMGDAQNSIHMHTFPEVPASVYNYLTMLNQDSESLTGVLAFNQGVTGSGLGSTAAAANGALSSAARRELGILRRLAEGMKKIARKFIAMNQVFLDEEEVVRITELEFVTIKRDDLQGKFDIRLSISTAEADEQKANQLAFMLQTTAQSMGLEFTKMILAEIAELRKMPVLAQAIRSFNPQPDPLAIQTKQLELALMNAEVRKLEAETQKVLAEASLSGYKAANTQADTDMKNLDFVNKESGIEHARDLELHSQQANAQLKGKLVDAAVKAQADKEKAEAQPQAISGA